MAVDILDNLIVLKVNKTSCEDVLGELCNAAIEAGYAKPGYHKAILEREAKYPTGLHIPLVEVAIPHADPEWANKPSLTIGILETPVPFGSMDGTGGDVMAGLVFMLTIEEPKDHIDFLRAISSVLGQPEILVEFAQTANPTLILEKIRANMPEKTKKTKSIEKQEKKL
jgi:galactitol PTS system EIIA component